MAQYTVIQDIEAEDKLLGPLSLRQFIYAVIVIVLGFIGFQLGRVIWFLAIPLLPPMVFFGLLAAPFGQTQSSEVWLLAKIRYFLFPRRRIWDQAGIQELVQITAPKKIDTNIAKGYSEAEVTSRLKALANTLDTRGWAIKNITSEMVQTPPSFTQDTSSDRLVELADVPGEAVANVKASDDVLDPNANPVASDLQEKLTESSEAHRQELLAKVKKLAAQSNTGTKPEAPAPTPTASNLTPAYPSVAATVVHPQPQAPEKPKPLQPIINNAGDVVHMPSPVTPVSNKPETKATSTMTTPANTGILDNVVNTEPTSMAVSHSETSDTGDDNEVVISLR